ncbi:MAG TPA: hypothetical protein PKC69_06365 [Chitinophagaceae bacterium]|nr:hypothetical protein [Chitinophagaceae bacterium]
MSKSNWQALRPIFFAFLVVNLLLLGGSSLLRQKGVDVVALAAANLILALVATVSFLLTLRSLQSQNPNVFVRAVYGSFIIKFFVIAIAAFVYIMIAGKAVNKPALFSSMFLYIVYTYLEVTTLLRILKQKKNA